MRTFNRGLLWVTGCLLALSLTSSVVAQDESAASQSQSTTISQPAPVLASAELPDSPGATQAQSQSSTPQQNNSAQPSGQAGAQPAQNSETQDQRPQRPVGTAAAEAPKVSGITAAEPAGVAIAPAKQHRARAIVIKVGAIIAAGAAVGGVVALTKATPSKPPGAH